RAVGMRNFYCRILERGRIEGLRMGCSEITLSSEPSFSARQRPVSPLVGPVGELFLLRSTSGDLSKEIVNSTTTAAAKITLSSERDKPAKMTAPTMRTTPNRADRPITSLPA